MKRTMIVVITALALGVAAPAHATTPKQFRAQVAAQKAKVATLKKQLAAAKKADAKTITGLKGQVTTLTTQVSTVTGQLAAANTASGTTIAGLNSTIAALNSKISAQVQGGLAAVLAGNTSDLFNAVAAIWQAFPFQPPAEICGFDKSNDITGGTGLNITRYSFVSYTNC
jgi:hypothetical protein